MDKKHPASAVCVCVCVFAEYDEVYFNPLLIPPFVLVMMFIMVKKSYLHNKYNYNLLSIVTVPCNSIQVTKRDKTLVGFPPGNLV